VTPTGCGNKYLSRYRTRLLPAGRVLKPVPVLDKSATQAGMGKWTMVVATSNEEGVAGWVRVSVFKRRWSARLWLVATFMRVSAIGQEISETNTPVQPQSWNWHVQNTIVVQYHPGFSAPYSGPNSMSSVNEVRESLSLDLYGGLRLWRGAEAHVDGLLWQGFGLSRTRGVEGFSNGGAFRLGNDVPYVNLARAFI